MSCFSRVILGIVQVLLLKLLLLLPFFHTGITIVYFKQMSERVITTRHGKVRGMLVEFPNRHLRPVEAYLGLRYGDLDNGGMRFMPPRSPKDKWSDISTMKEHKPVCPQPTKNVRPHCQYLYEGRMAQLRNITPFLHNQIEDCLYLNLYVPIQGRFVSTVMFSSVSFLLFDACMS